MGNSERGAALSAGRLARECEPHARARQSLRDCVRVRNRERNLGLLVKAVQATKNCERLFERYWARLQDSVLG